MLNRRHLRVKVLQALYAYFQSNDPNYVKLEENLMKSIEKIYLLYLYFLLFVRPLHLNRELQLVSESINLAVAGQRSCNYV